MGRVPVTGDNFNPQSYVDRLNIHFNVRCERFFWGYAMPFFSDLRCFFYFRPVAWYRTCWLKIKKSSSQWIFFSLPPICVTCATAICCDVWFPVAHARVCAGNRSDGTDRHTEVIILSRENCRVPDNCIRKYPHCGSDSDAMTMTVCQCHAKQIGSTMQFPRRVVSASAWPIF